MRCLAQECVVLPSHNGRPSIGLHAEFSGERNSTGLAIASTTGGGLILFRVHPSTGVRVLLRCSLSSQHDSRACAFVPSTGGRQLLAGCGTALALIDVERGGIITQLGLNMDRPRSMAVRPDQPHVVHVGTGLGDLVTFDTRVASKPNAT